jgi:hypothetical protein
MASLQQTLERFNNVQPSFSTFASFFLPSIFPSLKYLPTDVNSIIYDLGKTFEVLSEEIMEKTKSEEFSASDKSIIGALS